MIHSIECYHTLQVSKFTMKFLLVAVFLRFLLSVQAKVECEPGAEPMQLLTGGWRCKRTIIESGGPDRLYHTSMDKLDIVRCCPAYRQLVVFDEETRIGQCCGREKVYLGDVPNSECCLEGEVLKDGECSAPSEAL
ncbi:hypothetical protein WG66_000014 [Moniliophthora roreri]|nr:hypothetical protein WG66_000014 [Moniliophthora roreri]